MMITRFLGALDTTAAPCLNDIADLPVEGKIVIHMIFAS
jgi:hypothetical protein